MKNETLLGSVLFVLALTKVEESDVTEEPNKEVA